MSLKDSLAETKTALDGADKAADSIDASRVGLKADIAALLDGVASAEDLAAAQDMAVRAKALLARLDLSASDLAALDAENPKPAGV